MPTESDRLLRVLVLVVALVLAVPLLMMAFAMPMMGMMGWWMGDGMVGMSPLWGVAMMLLWLAVLVAIGYVAYRAVVRTAPTGHDSAMEELRRAYARGELTDEEFEARRERLKRD